MPERRTRQDLFAFLDWISEKGLMARNTAAARKAAANKVLGILSDDEAQDVTQLDLDDVMRRFNNLEGKAYTPGSLNAYFSRLRAALDDFKEYLDKPLNFRPGVRPRERRKPDTRKEIPGGSAIAQKLIENAIPPPPQGNVLSIPIRPDKTIVIHGLPYDLNEAEAAKIANVVRAMVTPASLPEAT